MNYRLVKRLGLSIKVKNESSGVLQVVTNLLKSKEKFEEKNLILLLRENRVKAGILDQLNRHNVRVVEDHITSKAICSLLPDVKLNVK